MGAGGSPRANTGPQSPHMGLWGAILGPGAVGAHPKGQGAAGAHPGGQGLWGLILRARGLRGPILGAGGCGGPSWGRGLRRPILGAGPGLRGACCKLCGGQEKGVTETWPCGL